MADCSKRESSNMPAENVSRSFASDMLREYTAIVVLFALLKLCAPLWESEDGFFASLIWLQIAVGPAIAAACAVGSQRLADYFNARKQRRADAT